MSEPNNQSPFARLTRSSVHNNKKNSIDTWHTDTSSCNNKNNSIKYLAHRHIQLHDAAAFEDLVELVDAWVGASGALEDQA